MTTKKKIQLLVFLLMPMLSISYAYGQNRSTTWTYPVRPGTKAWANLSSYEERLAAYNIPADLLQQLSTKELVRICLEYPEWRLINTRNSLQQGYDYLKSIFNGFSELEKRPGAGSELLAIYKSRRVEDVLKYKSLQEKGAYILKLTYLELLLSQNSILSGIPSKKELITLTVTKYESKKTMIEDYSLYGLMTPALILARTLELENDESLQKRKNTSQPLSSFIKDMDLYEPQELEGIISMSRDALNRM